MRRSVLSSLWAGAVVLTLPACSSIRVAEADWLHMLCVDSNGEPAELTVGNGTERTDQSHKAHAEAIAAAYRRWSKATGHRRIMLIVHGGLVSMRDAVGAATTTLAAMDRYPPDEPCFPIFVNWETGIGKSYVDHLFFVRGGRSQPLLAAVTWPFFLVADFGRAVARYPMTLFEQAAGLYEYYWRGRIVAPPTGWRETAWLDPSGDDGNAADYAFDLLREVVPGILRLPTTPLLDGMGVPAFQDMVRRARVLFVRDEDFDTGKPHYSGALPELFEALSGRKNEVPQITVVAHSMGCIVANELIHRYGHRHFDPVAGQETVHQFDFDTIVFMGAACTIREFSETTLPFLRDHEDARFYNLCLHPHDEADDRYLLGAVPHGSLLEWIDRYITDQQTAMDRTLGKWNNIVEALPLVGYLQRSVRDRIVIRGFPRGGDGPHDHGDFNDVQQRFWQRRFWDWR